MPIVLDTTSDLGNQNSSSWTPTAYTVTGSNPILFVAIMETGADFLTGIIYNNVALTLLGSKQTAGSDRASVWYLIGPTIGTNDIVITSSSASQKYGLAASYRGVRQTSSIDVSGVHTATSLTNRQVTLVTTVDNDWWFGFCYLDVGSPATAGTGATLRNTNGANTNIRIFDSNGAITPAGSTNVNVNTSVSASGTLIAGAFKPMVVGGGALFAGV